MVDKEIYIVRDTWTAATHNSTPGIEKLFYQKLFESSPELKLVFTEDAEANGVKFITMMNTIINRLDDVRKIHEMRNVGKNYTSGILRNQDYTAMKDSLFWALKTKLGDRWTVQVMISWIWFFSVLSYLMRDDRDLRQSA